ncbi:DUF3618 domain-containing protein [Actinopolymorpha alba]|uniref:DUF3618 domain-containing protein n=1 Tax=Actinopolymorpha alba TaxID=533267 RepID=UPI00036E73A8|nr:DUF3618 domain-containing protein [Actinopolymorpha alba]
MSDTTRPALPDRKKSGARKVAADGSRSADQIEAELAETRQRLAATVDALAERVQPKQLAARSVSKMKLAVLTPEGQLRTGRLVTVAAVVAGAVGALTLLRSLVRGRR